MRIQSSLDDAIHSLEVHSRDEHTVLVLKALASDVRLRILDLLQDGAYNVSEIGKALSMPLSTATLHIGVLENAGLIVSELQPAERGLQKLCNRQYDTFLVQLARAEEAPRPVVDLSMPVGAFVACTPTAPCGLASASGLIGFVDDPGSFFDPERIKAQVLWFDQGYVEYRFPNRLPPNVALEQVELSMELCSETAQNSRGWPSDITLWINDVDVGTWTTHAACGAQRGRHTPPWWLAQRAQHGMLKTWQVRRDGSYIDGLRLSDTSLNDLNIAQGSSISVRIGIREAARNAGGVHIFGRQFGNHAQDVLLRLHYRIP